MDSDLVRVVHLDQVESLDLGEPARWLPLRRALGLTGFGLNGYRAAAAGDEVIEPHDEASPGSGRHEEVYLVAAGHARFTIAGEEHDAPAGTLIRISPGVHRSAVAVAPETTVLVMGGRPGAAMPPSPFEYWYAAHPAYAAGDYRRAIAIASEGLEHHPRNPGLHYQLACYTALAGEREAAMRHLLIAVAERPETAGWAAEDADLDALRGDPRFPA
jgi:hypothetical protein